MDCTDFSQNVYVEAITLRVILFTDGVFGEVIKV